MTGGKNKRLAIETSTSIVMETANEVEDEAMEDVVVVKTATCAASTPIVHTHRLNVHSTQAVPTLTESNVIANSRSRTVTVMVTTIDTTMEDEVTVSNSET